MIKKPHKLDEMLDDSFPASDPPSFTPMEGIRVDNIKEDVKKSEKDKKKKKKSVD